MTQPLTDAEFALLDEYLMSEEAPEDAMDTSMLDGYLAAVASGPNLVMPDELLGWVWDTQNGEQQPDFASPQQVQQIVDLVLRHYQTVNDELNERVYKPRILQRKVKGKLVPIIDEWCAGYHCAIQADLAAWKPMMDIRPELFAVILLYGTPEGWERLKKNRLTDAQHQAAASSLEVTARAIHACWLDQRRRGLNRGDVPGILAARTKVPTPNAATQAKPKAWLH